MIKCTTKRLLLRWTGWFFLLNTIISFGIQITYLHFLTSLHTVQGAAYGRMILAWFFLTTSYVAHAAIINYFLAGITCLITILLPKKRVIFPVAFVLAASILIAQLVDRIAYSIFHTHALGEVWVIFKTKSLAQVLPLSNIEIGLLLLIIVLVLLFEGLIGFLILQAVRRNPGRHMGYLTATGLGICIVCSYTLMASVSLFKSPYRLNEANSHLILRMTRLVPYYKDLFDTIMFFHVAHNRIVPTTKGDVPIQLMNPTGPLQYPLKPLVCKAKKPLPNIVFIIIDTMRYDALNQAITPNLAKFAQKSWQFRQHWSGGNCTKTGIFSLFYGIPANYWNAMKKGRQGPLLLEELLRYHYKMAIYASATLDFPEFQKTVFVDVDRLNENTPGSSTVDRDLKITKLFTRFLNRRDKNRPFFGFLFYDSVHNYCEGSGRYHQKPFTPATGECARFALTNHSNPVPYINRYHNANYFVDQQVGKVLAALKKHKLMQNTIIIVTADHGEAFNDEKLGYWSHGTAYTPFQLHVPMLVYFPSSKPKVYNHFTTHMDIAPTLLTSVFGCVNPVHEYSEGLPLRDPNNRHFMIASSYDDYAVITKHKITRIYPSGDYVINYSNGHRMQGEPLDPTIMNRAYKSLNRYIKKKGDQHPR